MTNTQPVPPAARLGWVLALTSSAYFMVLLDSSVVLTALPLMQRGLPAHVWPMYERAGYASMDDFMAGHHWTFPADGAEPLTIGRRIEYTVLLPITDDSGAKPVLIFNFFPAPGATQAAITTGIETTDLSFYAEV